MSILLYFQLLLLKFSHFLWFWPFFTDGLQAAVGILTYAQQRLDVQLKESWYWFIWRKIISLYINHGLLCFERENLIFWLLFRYEKLQRWDDALKAYTAKAAQASSPHLVLEATLGLYHLVFVFLFFFWPIFPIVIVKLENIEEERNLWK